MHKAEARVNLAYAQEHASEIVQILRTHRFSDPQFIDHVDPHFALTLMVTPEEAVTLINVAAAMDDLEEHLGIKVFLLTPNEFERSGQRVPFYPILRGA